METKLVYVPKSPAGYDGPYEVASDYPVPFPHTDVPVPEGMYSPAFDYNSHQWVETAPVEMINKMQKLETDSENLKESVLFLTENMFETFAAGGEK